LRSDFGSLPILLVVLDGLADRPYPELGGLTPLEAASTPNMDRLAAEGQGGFHYPLGPGRVPSTELVHWRFFGYGDRPFPGRACVEALGAGVDCAPGDVFVFLALRGVVRRGDGTYRVMGGYGEDSGDTAQGYAELDGFEDIPTGYLFRVFPLDGGEAVLRIRAENTPIPPSGDVTDSDPFFFTGLPVLRPRPIENAADPVSAALTADAIDRFLSRAAEAFGDEPPGGVGEARRLVVGKWSGTFLPVPAFGELTGLRGVGVASGRLMRGLSRLLGLGFVAHPDAGEARRDVSDGLDPEGELKAKLEDALELLLADRTAGFAHVHTKAADEAAHAGDPREKIAVIERLDRGLAALLAVAPERLVACVTADHCTPVGGRTVHWGDSVPILVRGRHVRVDGVRSFGERAVAAGTLGQLRADDVLPFLLCQAETANFPGARSTPGDPLGVPASGEQWVYRKLESSAPPAGARREEAASRVHDGSDG
jgi:2,3-bisphosphoglycerate-independent phosphoglycerate mutase